MMRAHRLAYEYLNGPIPTGNHYGTMCVLHKCDNPKCVNPSHLKLGTPKDNTLDMLDKGRHWARCGTQQHESKINNEDVREIRRNKYSMTQAELGRKYGITQSTVSVIVNHKGWAHV